MFDVFGSLRAILKTDSTVIDNNVFRLHYKVTVILLVGFSLIVTSRQYIGDPISCIQPDEGVKDVINQFCWIHSTFTLPAALSKEVGKEVPHPGVDKYTKGEERVYHKYYQWVCFALFFQAGLFYIPRYIWKCWEGGRLKSLIMDLSCPILTEENKGSHKKMLIEYMISNMHNHQFYAACFVLCEVLNFINVLVNIYFVDVFLGGQFTTYGAEVWRYSEMDQEDRVDPMIKVFPRITKCSFWRYGSSGDVQKHDALCVLPLNIVNEKIYMVLWFWFVALALISAIGLIYRTMILVWPKSRLYMLKSKCRAAQREYIEIVVRKIQMGDWFVLYLLGKNMDGFTFKEFISELARRIEGKELV